MPRKHKVTKKDLQLLPDPVWVAEDNRLKPTPFFLCWWQLVAERRFGDKGRWLDAAVELGYVIKTHDPKSGGDCYDAAGFEYDPNQYRESLGITPDMPIMSQDGSPESYRRLWDHLLKAEQ